MATAETARLIASLELQDKFTPGINKADRALAGFEHRTTGSFGRIGTGIGKAGGNLKSFVSSGAGLFGVGLGIAGVAAGISTVIDKTADMAEGTQKFQKITGLSIEQSSKWVDVFDKFGIGGNEAAAIYNRLLVNSGKFTGTQKDAIKFSKEYGLSLTDNHGKLLSGNELLKRSADFFNSDATAAQKATALTKLYGKNWQQLIPLFSLRGKGIEEELNSAITLTPAAIKQMQDFVKTRRDFNDTFGDLQVKIGVALIPTLTNALKGLTTWVDQNSDQIVGFVQGMTKAAGELGSAIAGLGPVAKGIADAWASIPADVRKLLLGGLVANKVLKMTIGFDPIDIARQGVTDAIGKIVGGFFGRGSPANPMFTKEVGLPGAPTVPGAPPGTPPSITIPAIGAAIAIDRNAITGPGSPVDDLLNEVRSWHKESTTVGFTGFEGRGPGFRPGPLTPGSVGFTGFEGGGAGFRPGVEIVKKLDRLHLDFLANNAILKESTDPKAIAAAATAVANDVTKGVGSVGTTKAIISTLKEQIAATKDPAARRILIDALHRVERKLPGREWIAQQKADAAKIVKSNESVGQKVQDLKAIQRSLIAHGDSQAARIVGALINGVIPAINGIRIVQGTALPGILPS